MDSSLLGNNKEHKLSLGPYPDLFLKDARLKRDEIQTARAKGESPSRKIDAIQQSFSDIAKEWLTVRMRDRDEDYLQTIRFRLNKYVMPELGSRQLKDITSGKILRICRLIEDTGHDKTAKRVKAVIGQIYRYSTAAGYTDSDPTSALLGALRPRNNKHYATFTNPSVIASLVYHYTVIHCALLFPVYTFARPGEVRSAERTIKLLLIASGQCFQL